MRRLLKFKCYKNVYSVGNNLLTSILKFKRSKWFSIKQRFKKILNRKKFSKLTLQKTKVFGLQKDQKTCLNVFRIKKDLKRWNKLFLRSKEKISLRKTFFLLTGQAVTFKDLTKPKKKIESYVQAELLKAFLRIDVLLWLHNFFKTPHFARKAIKAGFVFLNNKTVDKLTFLSKGDFVRTNISVKQTKQLYSNSHQKFSFVEYDSYSESLIILKNSLDLDSKDLIFFKECINYPSFYKLF